jgi:hypothetical protein
VINIDTSLIEYLFGFTVDQLIRNVITNSRKNDVGRKVAPVNLMAIASAVVNFDEEFNLSPLFTTEPVIVILSTFSDF